MSWQKGLFVNEAPISFTYSMVKYINSLFDDIDSYVQRTKETTSISRYVIHMNVIQSLKSSDIVFRHEEVKKCQLIDPCVWENMSHFLNILPADFLLYLYREMSSDPMTIQRWNIHTTEEKACTVTSWLRGIIPYLQEMNQTPSPPMPDF